LQPAPPSSPPPDEPPSDGGASSPAPPRRRSRWRRRTVFWLTLVLLLVAARLALPIVLAPMVEDRLSRVLGANVEVRDMTFAPIDAVLTLHDVRVRALGQSDGPPALKARRIRADLQWLPLLHRALVVRELGLESATVDAARLSEGGVELGHLLESTPATPIAPGWTFELGRVALRDARLRLPGALDGGTEPIEVGVREAQFATQPRRASVFGRAPNLRIDAVLDGGRIRVDGSSDLRDNGLVVNALLRAKDVPVSRLKRYLPDLGLTDVVGRLSGQLHYQRDPGRRDRASGKLSIRRLAVGVAALEEPALTVRRTEIDVDAIDLLARRIVAESVTLYGARLAGRADVSDPLPLFAGMLAAPEPQRPAPARARVAKQVAPWAWRIGKLAAPHAQVRIPSPDGVAVLPASVSADDLGPAAYWSPIRASLRYGPVGATFDGTTRIGRGLSIAGHLIANDIDVPSVVRASGVSWADLAQAGRASVDLEVEVEPRVKDEPPVAVKGMVRVTDLWLAAPDPGMFALGAAGIDVKLKHVRPAIVKRGVVEAPQIAFSDAVLRSAYVQLVRDPTFGWVLPPFPPEMFAPVVDALGGPSPVAGATSFATPTPLLTASPAPLPSGSAGLVPAEAVEPPTEILLDAVRAASGRILLTDLEPVRTIQPVVIDALMGPPAQQEVVQVLRPKPLLDMTIQDATARGIRLPAGDVSYVVLQARDRRLGTLQIGGIAANGGVELQAAGQAVSLAEAAPFLTDAGLPYPFSDGTASFLLNGWVGRERWNADVTLVLQRPHLETDDADLRRQIGMSFDSAMAEMRDPDGSVIVPLSLRGTIGDPAVVPPGPTLADQVAFGIRQAVSRARQPLPQAPLLIACYPGRADPTPTGLRQIGTIIDMMARRPDLMIELSSPLTAEDRRWLGEQAVTADLAEGGGFMGVLRALGVRDDEKRIRDALEERASGGTGRLDADDQSLLDRMVAERPPISEDRLLALSTARLTRVLDLLSGRGGVARNRVTLSRTPSQDAAPGVKARVTALAPTLSIGTEGPP
jgi:hypothetical protein